MQRRDRLIAGTTLIVRLLRWGNYAFLALMIVALLGTWLFHAALAAQLLAKYGSVVPVDTVIGFIRILMLIGMVCVWPIEWLLRSLSAMLDTVRTGSPFVPANARRLRTTGWALLTLQFIDLLTGVLSWWARTWHIDVVDWRPSIIGWMCVLVAFVLARIFDVGTALCDELEGTI
ncbi:DUF2975 domain-containing protein [Sphingobium lignivorans]|uniref:DUF2975 domain-containing protein n=1 Tax=Sphingobium lignivorans TaxID=2735886 RepID=A0ABR6ND22_9SPHN|nr:DUF2975 domain-containing protein [Sphingobium lignivorans]MBB5985165.1 hypothetical protein [Sphingobium lignivorans]